MTASLAKQTIRGVALLTENANPYAPPALEGEFNRPAEPSKMANPRSWLRSLLIWSTVCWISAAPSFVWGMATIATQQAWAMCLGVLIFIVVYTLLDQVSQNHQWRCWRGVPLALKIGYGTRIFVSILFPIGGILDMFCGLLSINLVTLAMGWFGPEPLPMEQANFLTCLAITLVQGTILNIVLAVYTVTVLGLIIAIGNSR
ncbi:MAG: hypothetical protein KDB22_26440 [Planctomycetales bacterium]|nr:hypothetical protein [Planctomycetales bacterium]